MEKDTAEFVCDVYPEKSTVSWLLQGKPISTDLSKFEANVIGKTRHLVIRDAQEDDAGTVSAILGDTDCHAELSVQGNYNSHA